MDRKLRLDFGAGPGRFEVANLYAVLRAEIRKIEKALSKAVEESEAGMSALKPHQLRVASPGLYVDTFMGVRPATEPYSEEMRAQQVRARAAETAREQALANYYNFLAGRSERREEAGFRPVAVGRIISDRSIAVQLDGETPAGLWGLKIDGFLVKHIEASAGQDTLVFAFDDAQSWIETPDGHSYELEGPEELTLHFVLLPAING